MYQNVNLQSVSFNVPEIYLDYSKEPPLFKEIKKMWEELIIRELSKFLGRAATKEDISKCSTKHIGTNLEVTRRYLMYNGTSIGIIQERYELPTIDINRACSSYKISFIPAH